MSGHAWTKPEERDALRWYTEFNMKVRDIAKALEPPRTPQAVREKLRELGVLQSDKEYLPAGTALEMAKQALQREIALAKREMQRSQPFKGAGTGVGRGPLTW